MLDVSLGSKYTPKLYLISHLLTARTHFHEMLESFLCNSLSAIIVAPREASSVIDKIFCQK